MAENTDPKTAFERMLLNEESWDTLLNGDENTDVITWRGITYDSVQKAYRKLFENGGLPAKRFKTLTQMQTEGADLADGTYAFVADDTNDKNGIYIKDSGVWVKSKYTTLSLNDVDATLYNYIPDTIDLSTNDGKLKIKNTGRLIYDSRTKITPNIELDLPTDTGVYRIEFNTETDAITIKPSSSPINSNTVTFARLLYFDNEYTLYGIDNYSINGVPKSKIRSSIYGDLVAASVGNIDFDFDAKTITIAANQVRLIVNTKSILLPATTIDFSSATNGWHYLVYNSLSNQFNHYRTTQYLGRDDVIVGYFDTNRRIVYGIANYTVDGQYYGVGSNKSMYGKLFAASKEDIVIDLDNREINIAANRVRLTYDNQSLLLPETTISWANSSAIGWHYIAYSRDTKKFGVYRANMRILDSDVVVGYFNNEQNNYAVKDVPFYTLANQPDAEKSFKTIIHKIPYGNVYENYSPPELPSYKSVVEATDQNLTAFYQLYDDLVATYPDYIKMSVLAHDKDGNEIRQYRFCAPDVPKVEAQGRPKMILCGSVHGEKAGTYNLYNSLKHICEAWQTSEALTAIRWGADLVVVPIANPYAFINNTRKNGNGVDIARNFEVDWVNYNPAHNTYGGTHALSEIEAQTLDNVMSTHSDAIAFASHHSFFASRNDDLPNGIFCWIPHSTDFGANLGRSLIMQATVEAKKRYDWIAQGDNDWIGYANYSAPGGTEGLHATVKYGMLGCTFETTYRFHLEPNQPEYSSAVATMGVYCFINWILLNLRHTTEFYNCN